MPDGMWGMVGWSEVNVGKFKGSQIYILHLRELKVVFRNLGWSEINFPIRCTERSCNIMLNIVAVIDMWCKFQF